MTEIFYRLLSQANGDFFVLKKNERLNCFLTSLSQLQKEEHNQESLQILTRANEILETYQKMNLSNNSEGSPITERNLLAEKCLVIQNDIHSFITKKVIGVKYKSLSNAQFLKLMRSNITPYFYVSLYFSECRGKLLEYLLVHRE